MKFYLVGGFVRSVYTGEQTKDIDICVTGTTYEKLLEFLLDSGAQVILPAPEYHHLFFCDSAYQMPDDSNTTSYNMGVIKAKVKGEMIDFCLARKESDMDYSKDTVVPVSVINTPDVSIESDLCRRDFSQNAMAIPIDFDKLEAYIFKDIRENWSNYLDNLIDPFGGRQHIRERTIHPVGLCINRFTADPTRILRALKFTLRLDYQLSTYMQETLWNYEDLLCEVYNRKVNPNRSCNELVQVFKQAPTWRVMEEFNRYIPPSLLRVLFCDDRINLYPSLRKYNVS